MHCSTHSLTHPLTQAPVKRAARKLQPAKPKAASEARVAGTVTRASVKLEALAVTSPGRQRAIGRTRRYVRRASLGGYNPEYAPRTQLKKADRRAENLRIDWTAVPTVAQIREHVEKHLPMAIAALDRACKEHGLKRCKRTQRLNERQAAFIERVENRTVQGHAKYLTDTGHAAVIEEKHSRERHLWRKKFSGLVYKELKRKVVIEFSVGYLDAKCSELLCTTTDITDWDAHAFQCPQQQVHRHQNGIAHLVDGNYPVDVLINELPCFKLYHIHHTRI